MVMMRVVIFTVLLVLPQIIDCIQTTHHDGGAKISSRAISTTSRDAQNITDSSDRQRRLIPYMTFYLTRNYAQPQSTQYQLPPQKLQVQPVYQNKYVVSDYQPKYVVDTPLLSYRPKPSYTPFLDVNKIPGQFTPMLRNQPQSPQYQIQPTNDPNFSNIFDKLLQMKQNTKTIQYTPSPPPQYQTPKVITSQYYARRPTIKLIPVPNYGEQPQESYKPPEEYRTVQIIDNQNYKPTYVSDNYSYRPTENNHKYRLTSDNNNSYRPVSVADNHSYRPSVAADNHNYRPTVAADNHNYRPSVAADNHSYKPSVAEDNHNYRPTTVEENHNFRPTTVEENHSYRPVTIEDNHSYRPDDNQSYRPIGNFRPVINPENQGPKPILIVDEQSYKPIQPENQSYRPISLSDQARNQPIRLDIRPTIQTYSKPPPVQSENFKPSIQISNDQTYKTVYRPTTTPRPAPSHIKTIIHTYTPSSIEIPNRNEDYDGFESLKYRPKPPVKNVQIVPDDGYKQFVVIPQRASPDKNYDAYVLRPVQPSDVYRPVTTDRPELREPPAENPNSLSVILKQLQDSNTLPQTLTPDNIDNSIKTLVHILNSLKNTKLQRPIVVDEPDEDEEQEDEDEDVPTDISAISDYALNTPEGGTPGKAGHDYPAYSKIPHTTFDCKTQRYKGFFGDPDTNCQVWHYCDLNGGQASFLCPNGTIFSQVALTCDWWYNVKCATTTQLYVLNERLYKYILPFTPKFPEDYSGPLVDKYLALKFKEMEEKMRRQKKGKQKPKQDAPEGDVDKLQIIEAETVTKQLIPETDEVEQNDKEQQKK